MGLHGLDLAIVVLYMAGMTLFGLRFRGGRQSLKAYFLADGAIPWWAISLSIVAAETSTLTVISVPGLAFGGDLGFLQLAFGYIVGRIVVSIIFLPRYFRGGFLTAYQFIEQRFGTRLRVFTAGIFLVTRAAAEGVRVFAVAVVVRTAFAGMMPGLSGWARDMAAIGAVTILTLLYTCWGGLRAAIWTDVLQQAIYITGTLIGFVTLLHLVPGGWNTIASVAGSAGKFHILNFSWNPTVKYTFWSGLIGGTFLTMASHGTDQLIVQRLLAARNATHAKTALIASGIIVFLQFALFLIIGVMLFVYYRTAAPGVVFTDTDRVFPQFIVSRMPQGVSGLLIGAILAAAMSNLSAAVNSLSSTAMIDFYARLQPESSEERRLLLARWTVVLWGIVLFVLAMVARHGGRVIEVGLSIASVAYGAMLGVFLLGILKKGATQTGAMIGMIAGLALNLSLWLYTKISFTWYALLGCAVTCITGILVSYFTGSRNQPETAGVDHAFE